MKDKFYVTTSIVYTNAKPHIGFALESIQADFLARWNRSRGREVFFLTGTDEHGIKIARTAAEAGEEPQKFVDRVAGEVKNLRGILNLSWDRFIRTSDKKNHWPGAEELWRRIEKNGDIYEKEYQGLYCVGCERFLAEKDLKDGLCPLHQQAPELIEEKNLFFRLSKYSEQIKRAIESGELQIYPETRRNETLAFIASGLEDISFSRSREKLEWGIPIPGHDGQVMYVWCDALANYISAIGYKDNEKEFKKWWPVDAHVIGKDIMRFHTIYWPAMLSSAGLPLPKCIYVHGFITAEGKKMSKSLGNVVYPDVLVEKYGTDAVRYYFLAEVSSHEDGDFNERRFVEHYNADLANGLGNFAARVSTLAEQAGQLDGLKANLKIEKEIEKVTAMVAEDIKHFRLNEAVARIWALIKFGDNYINTHKPWETKDAQIIFDTLVLLAAVAKLVEPIVPEAAGKIKAAIEGKGDKPVGAKKIANLFPRLDA
ncbi:MAG: methionine--tRNA ligase [Candidatus Colwellbacteria bacterium RBG_13_48_8]|uniref:Methionine--tRNA ligase n=1 Tax=Candidatus Colwellbacteria bacterium RBG_13_48_8 TaxID=1797685 RepID=A0A1G1YVE4_9BACT|nr:MAG: methionine--tRNA ligase [Candidatus Colwellbacteria bacterium RBG_13_48_8]